MEEHHQIPIWYFIGILLTVYGVLILGSGIYSLIRPPQRAVALGYLHADIWWGALLLALGILYVLKFRPARDRRQ